VAVTALAPDRSPRAPPRPRPHSRCSLCDRKKRHRARTFRKVRLSDARRSYRERTIVSAAS
jgi:hypothetical protein